jgi:hypothetical protein
MNISASIDDVGAPIASPSFCVYISLLCCLMLVNYLHILFIVSYANFIKVF